MKNIRYFHKIGFALAILIAVIGVQYGVIKNIHNTSRFDSVIAAFEADDLTQPPKEGAIVIIGSSSIRGWTSMQSDLSPLTVIPRGFGGSTMSDALRYINRIVIPYKPRAVVIYEGENDLSGTFSRASSVANKLEKFISTIHQELKTTRIYIISIKPSPSKSNRWEKMQRANSLFAKISAGDERVHYIDISKVLMDSANGQKQSFYKEDGIHLNASGMAIWSHAIRQVLIREELCYEESVDC